MPKSIRTPVGIIAASHIFRNGEGKMFKTIARPLFPALVLVCCWSVDARADQWAQKLFDRQSIDFGVIARGSNTSIRVKITNIYKQTVHISGVRTTCGCSAAKPSRSTLRSRETAFIEVTMNTRRFIRKKDSNLIVTFDAPRPAEVRIPITAYIRTDVVLTPGSANFGAVEQGAGAQRKISIEYAGRDNWTIERVDTRSDFLSTQLNEIDRGSGRVQYELYVQLNPETPAGTLREQITLVTDDANGKYVPILVEARIEPDIVVTEIVSLGTLTPGTPKTVNVVLRGKKPFRIEEVDFDNRSFSLKPPAGARRIHILPLTVTPSEPGELSEQFRLTIAGRPQPILFRAYGRVANTAAP